MALSDYEPFFWKYVMPEPNSGCWLWTGRVAENGYGRFWWGDNGSRLAHRYSYWLRHGAMPDEGLEIDHRCRVRCCVNPDHLRAVTKYVNIMCGVGFSAVNAKKTHCANGHEFTLANTYSRPGRNERRCRACHREEERKRKAWLRTS
jgi:hypothetical protein